MGEVQGMQGVAELKRFSLKTKGMVYWSYMGTRHGVLRENVMEMLGLKETVVQIAKANGVRWYGHILRREDGHVLRKALEFEVKGKRKRGQPDRKSTRLNSSHANISYAVFCLKKKKK